MDTLKEGGSRSSFIQMLQDRASFHVLVGDRKDRYWEGKFFVSVFFSDAELADSSDEYLCKELKCRIEISLGSMVREHCTLVEMARKTLRRTS